MSSQVKPESFTGNTMTRSQRIVEGTKNNSESLGISLAVVASWALTTYTGVNPPVEVVGALGALIGAVSARFKG